MLLIAPQTTEWATKVAVLASLTVVCAAWALSEIIGPPAEPRRWSSAHFDSSGRPVAPPEGAAALGSPSSPGVLVVVVDLAAPPSVVAADTPGTSADDVAEVLILPLGRRGDPARLRHRS